MQVPSYKKDNKIEESVSHSIYLIISINQIWTKKHKNRSASISKTVEQRIFFNIMAKQEITGRVLEK